MIFVFSFLLSIIRLYNEARSYKNKNKNKNKNNKLLAKKTLIILSLRC